MKPDYSIMPEREAVKAGKRKALTRRETIALCLRQEGRCGCGCGKRLDPMGEGVIDEHLDPREISARDDLDNRALYRKPCAKAKTVKDQGDIARVKKRAGETGQQAKRAKRDRSPWPSRKLEGGGKLPTKAVRGKD